jgi:hypothetical protein
MKHPKFQSVISITLMIGCLVALLSFSVPASAVPNNQGAVTYYEAEAGARSGAAVVSSCSACSGGQKVGYIGNGSANYVTLTVNAGAAGSRTMTVYYTLSGSRSFYVSVNGGGGVQLSLSGSNWNTPVSATMNVSLNAGNNTIRFYNNSAYAPDLDRIAIPGGGTPGPTNTPTPTPTPGTCNVAPVDSNATAAARRLLCYLYSQYGNHIISGQQESTWVSGPDYEMNYIYNNTGKYPAIRGMDRGDSPDFGSRALAWWNSGGIPMVGYHMGSPAQGTDGYNGSRMSANINAALTPGTADYTRLTQRLDGLAAQLQIVQNGGGAVILRLWHEAGGTWFWWSMEGGSQYVRLWQFSFNYLTRTKGLHNMVWLHPYNGSPNSSFYPGKAYVDIGGADTYASNHDSQISMFNATKNIVGSTIPIALHENGPIPDPDLLQSDGARWVLFNTWHTSWIVNTSTNPISLLQKVYTSSYVVTRDEVPNLR